MILSYQDMRNSLGILKLMASGENDIENQELIEHASVFQDAQDLLGNA